MSDSSDDDDDDGLGYSSPDNSANNEVDDDDNKNNNNKAGPSSHHHHSEIDPFKFTAKKFSKVNTAVTSHQYPSPNRHGRAMKRSSSANKNDDDIDQKLSAMKRKNMIRLAANEDNKRKKPNNKDSDDDDDSDSDDGGIEIVDPPSKNTKDTATKLNNARPPIAPHPAAFSKRRMKTRSQPGGDIELLSSDDDDDDDDDLKGGPITSKLLQNTHGVMPPEVAAAIQKAKIAKSKLNQAQRYHAHDVYVPVPDPPEFSCRTNSATRWRNDDDDDGDVVADNADTGDSEILQVETGNVLRFTIRGELIIGNEKERLKDVTLKIKDNERLEVLRNKLCKAHNLRATDSKISMHFDGEALDINKTPKQYDMEDEDMIDCTGSASRS
jgi:hypothetical protein